MVKTKSLQKRSSRGYERNARLWQEWTNSHPASLRLLCTLHFGNRGGRRSPQVRSLPHSYSLELHKKTLNHPFEWHTAFQFRCMNKSWRVWLQTLEQRDCRKNRNGAAFVCPLSRSRHLHESALLLRTKMATTRCRPIGPTPVRTIGAVLNTQLEISPDLMVPFWVTRKVGPSLVSGRMIRTHPCAWFFLSSLLFACLPIRLEQNDGHAH